jgi:Protein of unknown function (DUF3108)
MFSYNILCGLTKSGECFHMRISSLSAAAVLSLSGFSAFAESLTVNYSMSVAGLPIGSATMILTPGDGNTAVAVTGRAGGPFEIGRIMAAARVAAGDVQATSQSGSGKSATTASLTSKGTPGNSTFNYAGQTTRGPASLAMILASGRVTKEQMSIPDNPTAVRVPVTEAHKSGIIDPLSIIALMIKPGGTLVPEALCGRTHAIFTGQTRFTLSGSPLQDTTARGLPEGWRAVTCKVTHTPVSGHRIDKGNDGAKARTGTLTFARTLNGERTILWSLSAPAFVGSFTLTANSVK